MKKQYIKPLTKAHTLFSEQPILAGSFKARAKDFDVHQKKEDATNWGLSTDWTWGNGDGEDVYVD